MDKLTMQDCWNDLTVINKTDLQTIAVACIGVSLSEVSHDEEMTQEVTGILFITEFKKWQ